MAKKIQIVKCKAVFIFTSRLIKKKRILYLKLKNLLLVSKINIVKD